MTIEELKTDLESYLDQDVINQIMEELNRRDINHPIYGLPPIMYDPDLTEKRAKVYSEWNETDNK